tara:strand:+ start:219 stop:920 length:702 start_codon:yes stop_codon:yes gene_type:complete
MKITQITERAKHAKAKDKKPKVNKPNLGHESPHPMQGKMVGEAPEDTGMYNPPNSDNKLSHNRYLIKQFIRYAKDVVGFDTLDELKKEEHLDKVIAHMQNDGIDVMEGDVVDISTPLPAEFINWLKTKNLNIGVLKDRVKMRQLRIEYERETGRKVNEEDSLEYNSLEESVGQFITEEEFDQLAEKQDACYHKVKSRYKVWPSAYASGALVRCRKVGAKNWGNSKKKKKKSKK